MFLKIAPLESLPWAGVFDVYHIDEKIKFVSDLILLLFDTHAPIKTFRKNKNYKYTPWITDNIKLMIKLRHKALKSFKKSKTPSDYDYYKQLRNYTTMAIRTEKKPI